MLAQALRLGKRKEGEEIQRQPSLQRGCRRCSSEVQGNEHKWEGGV